MLGTFRDGCNFYDNTRHYKKEHTISLPPQLRKISPTVWELPVSYKEGMRVPARIIASESLLGGMEAGVFDQAANVACPPASQLFVLYADACSDKAIEQGVDQIGTLGSGNHYCEIQVARPENIFDEATARAFGITVPNQVVIMFYCGKG